MLEQIASVSESFNSPLLWLCISVLQLHCPSSFKWWIFLIHQYFDKPISYCCFNFSRSLFLITYVKLRSPALLGFFYLFLHGIGCFSLTWTYCLSVFDFLPYSSLGASLPTAWRSNHKYQFLPSQFFSNTSCHSTDLKHWIKKKFMRNGLSLNVIF